MSKVDDIIEKVVYVTIASVDDTGQPWNTPVFSAYDNGKNFYWGSNRDSQHSKNIRTNGNVYLVIYDSTADAGTGEGVYVKAKASEIDDPAEVTAAHALLQKRRPVPYWRLEDVQWDAPVRLYKAVPEKIWLNDDAIVNGIYIDVLKEVA